MIKSLQAVCVVVFQYYTGQAGVHMQWDVLGY